MHRIRIAVAIVAVPVLAAWLWGLCPGPRPYDANAAPPEKDDAPRKLNPGQSGLLLRPIVDLSSMTPDKFAENIDTVGPEKIRRPWTSPIAALSPHARRDVKGLTEMEVGEYMLTVRRMFDQGKSIPVSDVGLISTEDGPVRKPIYNHVAAFANDVANVYLLVQRETGDKNWAYFSIVQDRTTDPPSDYYGRIDGEEVSYRGARCYRCHSSGPLAIHSARPDLVSDAKLAEAINKYIVEQPQSRFVFWKGDPRRDYGKPLALKACAKCHDAEDGVRSPLFKVHEHPIRVLVDHGYMPPNRRLSAEEMAELRVWLNPLEGWKAKNEAPDDKVVSDHNAYIEQLSQAERAGVVGVNYYLDATGQHGAAVLIRLGDTTWTHLLVYDKKYKRTDMQKFAAAK